MKTIPIIGLILCAAIIQVAAADVFAGGDDPTTRVVTFQPGPQVLRPEEARTPPSRPMPPLSIHESCLILRDIVEELEGAENGIEPERRGLIDRMLRAVALYVERVDRNNPNLSRYRWRRIINQRLPDPDWREYGFTLTEPLDDISALALRAHHGDVEIGSIIAVDENGTRWEFTQGMLLVRGRTRVDVCHLPLPTRLSQVRVTCRHSGGARRPGRLSIDAGVSPKPEHARAARFYLQLARDKITRDDPLEAATHLRAAFSLLQAYQRARRL